MPQTRRQFIQDAGHVLLAVPVAVSASLSFGARAQSTGQGTIQGGGVHGTQVQVTGVRFHEDRGRMKLHLDLDRLPESHHVFTLPNPGSHDSLPRHFVLIPNLTIPIPNSTTNE